MKITVIGGGNIGTLMAAEMAAKGHEVTVYTSKPENWKKTIHVFDNGEVILSGNLSNVTSNIEEAIKGADLIWITMPAQMFDKIAAQMLPYIQKNQMIGVVPGSGGAEFAFIKLLEKGAILFGLQRVHSIARLEKYGESVHMLGRKSNLKLGAIPAGAAAEISETVESLFDIPCDALPNYLCVTLTPSNPILHTTRLCTMFRDYEDGIVYPRNFLFYEEWNDSSSQLLIDCDDELQKLCDIIPLNLKAVESLRSYYESADAQQMTKKISGISAFKGLTSPMIKTNEGWIPDFESRYFTTDFPYGLKIIKDLAQIYCVKSQKIDDVWNWYLKFDPKHAKSAISLLDYSQEEIEKLYK